MSKETLGIPNSWLELILLGIILMIAFPLDFLRFIILTVSLIVLYGFTMKNSYMDGWSRGYSDCINERVY